MPHISNEKVEYLNYKVLFDVLKTTGEVHKPDQLRYTNNPDHFRDSVYRSGRHRYGNVRVEKLAEPYEQKYFDFYL